MRAGTREPGFYASLVGDRTFFVAATGEAFELVAELVERIVSLPDVERFGHELPSMMFQMASFLGIDAPIPPESTHLLIDEIYWEGRLGVASFDPQGIAELAELGLVLPRGGSAVLSDTCRDLLDQLGRALVVRPFDSAQTRDSHRRMHVDEITAP
jgi:hypothetical protein